MNKDRGERRAEIMKPMSAKEKAVFLFLEYLDSLKRQMGDKALIIWEFGRSTQNLLDAIYNNNLTKLPLPKEHEQTTFTWMMFLERKNSTPVIGSSDLRIYNVPDGLKLKANDGTLRGMDQYFHEAFDEIDVPVSVTDRKGFKYSNPASET